MGNMQFKNFEPPGMASVTKSAGEILCDCTSILLILLKDSSEERESTVCTVQSVDKLTLKNLYSTI